LGFLPGGASERRGTIVWHCTDIAGSENFKDSASCRPEEEGGARKGQESVILDGGGHVILGEEGLGWVGGEFFNRKERVEISRESVPREKRGGGKADAISIST